MVSVGVLAKTTQNCTAAVTSIALLSKEQKRYCLDWPLSDRKKINETGEILRRDPKERDRRKMTKGGETHA